MTLHLALSVAALAASAILLFSSIGRPIAGVAAIASALEVAMAAGALRVHLPGAPLGLGLGLALALPGLLAWVRAGSKAAVSAASVLALAGLLQVFVAAHGRI